MTGINTAAEDEHRPSERADTTATLPERLRAVLEQEQNMVCAECPEPQPTWACLLTNPLDRKDGEGGPVFMGIMCCYKCYGAHFQLGEGVGQVKSTRRADDWAEEEIHVLENSGNQVVNEIYESKLTPEAKEEQHKQDKDAFVTDKYKSLKYFSKKKFQQHLKWMKKCVEEKEERSIGKGRKTFKLPGRTKSSREKDSSDGNKKVRTSTSKTLQAIAAKTTKTIAAIQLPGNIAAMPSNISTPSFDWGSFSKANLNAEDATTEEHPQNDLGASLSEHGTRNGRKSGSLDTSLLKEIAAELDDNPPDTENAPLRESTQEEHAPGPSRGVARTMSSADRGGPKRVVRRGVRQTRSNPHTLLAMVSGVGGRGAERTRKLVGENDDEEDDRSVCSHSRREGADGTRVRRKPSSTRAISGEEESDSGKVPKSRSSSRRGSSPKRDEEGMKDHSGRSLGGMKDHSGRSLRKRPSRQHSSRRRIKTASSTDGAPKRATPTHRTPRRAKSDSGDVIPQRARGQSLLKKNASTELAPQPTESCPYSPPLQEGSAHSKLSLSESLSKHLDFDEGIQSKMHGSILSLGSSAKSGRNSLGGSSLAGSEGRLALSPRRSSDGSLDIIFANDFESAATGAPPFPFISSIDDIVVEKRRPNSQCPNGSTVSLLDSGLFDCPDSPSSDASLSSSDLLGILDCNTAFSERQHVEKCKDRSSHSKRSSKSKDHARSSKHESTNAYSSHSIGSSRRKHRISRKEDEDTTIEATILALKAINKTSVAINSSTQKLAFKKTQNRPSSSPNIGLLLSGGKSGTKSTSRLSSNPLSTSNAHGQKNYEWTKHQSKVNTSNIRNQLLVSAVDPLLNG